VQDLSKENAKDEAYNGCCDQHGILDARIAAQLVLAGRASVGSLAKAEVVVANATALDAGWMAFASLFERRLKSVLWR
jgi:hypothetical protein